MTDSHDPLTPRVRPIPWADFTEELLALYQPPMAARKTAAKLAQAMRELAELGVETTADLTPVLIARFVSSRPWSSQHTLKSLLSSVRTACSYAEESRYVTISPFRLRKMAKFVKAPPPRARDTSLARRSSASSTCYGLTWPPSRDGHSGVRVACWLSSRPRS